MELLVMSSVLKSAMAPDASGTPPDQLRGSLHTPLALPLTRLVQVEAVELKAPARKPASKSAQARALGRAQRSVRIVFIIFSVELQQAFFEAYDAQNFLFEFSVPITPLQLNHCGGKLKRMNWVATPPFRRSCCQLCVGGFRAWGFSQTQQHTVLTEILQRTPGFLVAADQ
jgi:hypothetical protein